MWRERRRPWCDEREGGIVGSVVVRSVSMISLYLPEVSLQPWCKLIDSIHLCTNSCAASLVPILPPLHVLKVVWWPEFRFLAPSSICDLPMSHGNCLDSFEVTWPFEHVLQCQGIELVTIRPLKQDYWAWMATGKGSSPAWTYTFTILNFCLLWEQIELSGVLTPPVTTQQCLSFRHVSFHAAEEFWHDQWFSVADLFPSSELTDALEWQYWNTLTLGLS